ETQTSLSFQFRIAQNTISGIIPAVCMDISQVLQNEFMKVPDCPEEWRKVANDFMGTWNFPMCLGALDAYNEILTLDIKLQFELPCGMLKIKSYRPVTLLSTIGKVLKQILLRRLNHTLKKKNLLHHNKFGFKESRSTDDG
ncbi:hypothetical protein AVEN_107975-1, partial [Araneus ventricosus]